MVAGSNRAPATTQAKQNVEDSESGHVAALSVFGGLCRFCVGSQRETSCFGISTTFEAAGFDAR
jgi:hypothetical protein